MIVPALPYMGSKRKIATKIINQIYRTVGDFNKLYDLFGGGGAVTSAALIAGHTVVYNELNSGIANLMQYIKDGGEIPNKWVSREEFFKYKDGDDWYSGLLKCMWSFGNKQDTYMFGKDVEPLKRLAHLVVVNQDESARVELSELLKVEIPPCKDRHDFRRFVLLSIKTRQGELQQLERLERLEQLQQLLQLEQLEQLQQLQQLERLEIFNMSYQDVPIGNKAVVYCDPPYKGTAKYQEDINQDDFYKWCLTQNNPVFISGYNMPKEFIEVLECEHRSTLSAISNNKVIEKLYWNGKRITE